MPGNRDRLRRAVADAVVILIGSWLFSLSVVLFSAPREIAPGGVTGIATLLNYLCGVPIGTAAFLLNIPLLIAARLRLGGEFTRRTLAGLILTSVWIDLAGAVPLFARIAARLPADRVVTCLFGGALMGLGMGLILSRGSSTGGGEIIARLLEKRWPQFSVGRLILGFDAVVIGGSALVYRELESPLYAVLYVFVCSLVTDRVVYGGRHGKLALILSENADRLTPRILASTGRGVTLLNARGGYTGRSRRMLLCAVGRDQVYRLKRTVFDVDRNAFFMLLTTDEVLGLGWLDADDL